ncbi:type VII secretion integral membrane protein EccD [Dactylosporangium fulvum]|uniref:type VII secretion integral membrane protein EccD n=1 Tax=Dactylosporangium fulvum TaxID=53359 RepID=UPI0031D8CDC9
MAEATRTALTRIVLLSPKRRVDLALPEYLPLVTLQPMLLRHAGAELADEGIAHHGWVLRRLDGTMLDADRSLAMQQVRDGETLVLAPQDQQWPEPEFDDLADAAANEARNLGATWQGGHTRRAGAVFTAATLVTALVVVLRAGPAWGAVGAALAGAAVLLVGFAALLTRLDHNDRVIWVLSGLAYVYVAPGVALLATGEGRLGPAQLLAGATGLVALAVLSMIGVGGRLQLHVAVLCAGLLAALGAALAMMLTSAAAAAIVAAVALLASPWLPRIATHQAGLATPTVSMPSPETADDDPLPPPAAIALMVRRGDELITGLLYGIGAALTGCVTVLASRVDLAARLLAVAIVVVCALRARSFAAVRHRVPLLAAASAGTAAMLIVVWESIDVATRGRAVFVAAGGLLLLAGGAFAAGRSYALRRPSPQLSRIGDVSEIILIALSAVLAAAVSGLFGYVRGIGG